MYHACVSFAAFYDLHLMPRTCPVCLQSEIVVSLGFRSDIGISLLSQTYKVNPPECNPS